MWPTQHHTDARQLHKLFPIFTCRLQEQQHVLCDLKIACKKLSEGIVYVNVRWQPIAAYSALHHSVLL